MIVLDAILRSAINPALSLLPVTMDSDAARVMLLAIGLQESRLLYRVQRTTDPYRPGPAAGLWQFERGGGVAGVMSHKATHAQALELCRVRRVPFDSSLIWSKLPHDDILAAGFARLLLWSDARPLPAVDASHDDTWAYYARNWRPGRPRRERWNEFHEQARAQVMT